MKTFSTIRERLHEIDLIRNGSVSPLVSGDNAPIGSQYLGPEGIPWTKTGATSTAWVQHLLRTPYLNVKTFGAVGDGVTDDRPAIQLAIDAAWAAGGGVVFFPPGDYNCVITGSGVGGIPTFLFTGAAQGNILFLGCGRSSLIFMSSPTLTGDRRLFDIREGANHIGFKSLRFRSDIVNVTEQQHLLHWSSTAVALTGEAFVEDCYIQYTRGDGIRFLGNDTFRVSNINVRRVCAQMQDFTARTFMSFQRSTDNVTADACYNQDVSAIDFEPTGTGSLENNRFHRNVFTGILTITGNDVGQQSRRGVFANNIVHDGSLSGLNVEYWVIAGNLIETNTAGIADFPLSFRKRTHMLAICDNLLLRGTLSDTEAGFIDIENQGAVGDNYAIVIDGNLGFQVSSLPTCVGFQLRDLPQVIVTNNLILPRTDTIASSNFIVLEEINDPIVSAVVSNNLGLGLDQRMAGGFAGGGANVLANGNFFRQVNNGILIDADPDGSLIMASRNMLVSQSSSVSILGTGIGLPVDGIASLVGPTVFSVINTPEANVPAVIGSTALRVSGGGAGSTWYVKEADSGLATGWVAK